MATLVHKVIDAYNDALDNGDPRVKNWFLMGSPLPTVCICLTYVYIVRHLGPRLMANRKPFELKKTILAYNLVQVFISAHLFSESIASGWGAGYSFFCQPVDYSDSPQAMRMAWGCYLYYLSKFSELFDTVFFVLRKKNNQITNLHVVHHGIMPFSVWIGVKYCPGGHGSFFGMLNTFVHIWMYLYYFLAALGPAMQPYLWWKKYLTVMQLIQFVLVLLHSMQLAFIECEFPKAIVWYTAFHAVLFFFMFRNFYSEAYKLKSAPGKKKKPRVDQHEDAKRNGVSSNDSEESGKKRRETGKEQSSIYANNYKVATGYISDEGLRNRVFIDKNCGFNHS